MEEFCPLNVLKTVLASRAKDGNNSSRTKYFSYPVRDKRIVLCEFKKYVPQSGNDKELRALKYNKSKNSKTFERNRQKVVNAKHVHTAEGKKEAIKKLRKTLHKQQKDCNYHPHGGDETPPTLKANLEGIRNVCLQSSSQQALKFCEVIPRNIQNLYDTRPRLMLGNTVSDLKRVFPQSVGTQVDSLLKKLQGVRESNQVPGLDKVLSIVEAVVACAIALSECNDFKQAVAIFTLFVKTFTQKSLSCEIMRAFEQLFTTPQGSGSDSFFSSMRHGLKNWREYVKSPNAQKLSDFLSLCVSVGLCDMTSVTWKHEGFVLFAPAVWSKSVNAFDFVDAAFDTFLCFAEGGWRAWQTGDPTFLLYGDDQAIELEKTMLFLQTNIVHVKTGNLESVTGVDENAFSGKLDETIEILRHLHATATQSWERHVYYERLATMLRVRATFAMTRCSGGLREAPFSVEFFGKSGVGKSSLCSIYMVAALKANGFCAKPEKIVTLSETDKYMSNYRSDVNGVILDDLSNSQPGFVERAPTARIIELMNNVKIPANMAEADMKGKVSVEPKIVAITTNRKELDAATYSQEPVSILRRNHIVVTVRVKPEFTVTNSLSSASDQMLDSEKVAAFYTNEAGITDVPAFPDLWDLDLQRAVPIASSQRGTDTIGWEPIIFEGKEMMGVSLIDFLDVVVHLSRQHFKHQKTLVKGNRKLDETINFCQECASFQCSCFKPEAGAIITSFIASTITTQIRTWYSKFTTDVNTLETLSTKALTQYLKWSEPLPWMHMTSYIPRPWLDTQIAKSLLSYWNRDVYLRTIRWWSALYFTTLGLTFTSYFFGPREFHYGTIVASTFGTVAYTLMWRGLRERMHNKVVQRSDAMPAMLVTIRDTHFKTFLKMAGCAGTAFLAFKTLKEVYNNFRVPETQGNLQPRSYEEVMQRDKEQNVWLHAKPEKFVVNDRALTSTHEQNLRKVASGLVFNKFYTEDDEFVNSCDGLFLESNVMIMPYHVWHPKKRSQPHSAFRMQCQRFEKDNVGSSFSAILDKSQMVRIPETDLCVVYVPNSGDHKNNTYLLPKTRPHSGQADLQYRNADGTLGQLSCHVEMQDVGHSECSFFGGKYTLAVETFPGLCMATLVSKGYNKCILGFHLGGQPGANTGVAGNITHDQYANAVHQLSLKETVLLGVETGIIPESLCGVMYRTGESVNPKNPVHYLEGETNLKILGGVTGAVSPHSTVVKTVISDTVEEVMGVPNKWGKPKLNNPKWKPWYESLKHSARPSIGVKGSLLEIASRDYRLGLLPLLTKEFRNEIRPLEDIEIVCGRPGKRFIDRMQMSTSIGFPLAGPKSQRLVQLSQEDYPEYGDPVEFDTEIMDMIRDAELVYAQGKRNHAIFKACLKDEATPLTKDKVRVFQASAITLQYLVRKYYLPLARFMSVNPLDSECAVGINCQGPEWEQLQGFISTFGEDRILAGDYGKYDLRMPAQVTLAAFKILISFAELTGNYTQRDIVIMKGLAYDICYPTIAFNGALIQFIGTNPSGQNLTVYINGIVNSLLARCAFFEIYPEAKSFRQGVKICTYGDDLIGSVSSDYEKFNHVSMAAFLARHDMEFTMPDKTSDPVPFMNLKETDFLKRRSVYHPDVEMHFGALDENSIYKSLHAINASKHVTADEQAIQNMEGASREWFLHGREIYEERRHQLMEIAQKHKFVLPCLQEDYDYRLKKWRAQYLDTE